MYNLAQHRYVVLSEMHQHVSGIQNIVLVFPITENNKKTDIVGFPVMFFFKEPNGKFLWNATYICKHTVEDKKLHPYVKMKKRASIAVHEYVLCKYHTIRMKLSNRIIINHLLQDFMNYLPLITQKKEKQSKL